MAKTKYENFSATLLKAKTLEEAKKIAEEAIAEGTVILATNGELSKAALARDREITKLNDQQNAERVAHEQTKTEAQSIISALKSQLAESEQKVEEGPSAPEVKHNNIVYLVTVPKFKLAGIEYEAKELKKHPAIVAELIEMGAAVLVKK